MQEYGLMPNNRFCFDNDARPWQRGVAELALACAGSYAADEAERLNELLVLLRSCPPSIEPGLIVPEAGRLAQLLAADAAAAAVMELFEGADAGYLLSRGGGGQYLASVIMPGAAEEVSAGGESAALAMLGAIALALADMAPQLPLARDLRAPGGVRLN